MILNWNKWQAEQELNIPLLQRILVVELKPVVKVLVDLVVGLSRDLGYHRSPAVVWILLSLGQNFISLSQVCLRHVLDSKVVGKGLLFFHQLFQVGLTESVEVGGNLHFLEEQLV